jgi:hypothetical protein
MTDDVERVARACALLEGENWRCWLVVANTALTALDLPARDAASHAAGVQAERERVVAWLRSETAVLISNTNSVFMADLADAIERGVHRSNDHDER